MTNYLSEIQSFTELRDSQGTAWNAISPEYAARMALQNRFKTGLDIARYTAAIMRRDMEAYDADSSSYTQSLGLLAWLHRSAEDDLDQEASRHDGPALPLPVGLDGGRAALRGSAPCPISRCTRRRRCPS